MDTAPVREICGSSLEVIHNSSVEVNENIKKKESNPGSLYPAEWHPTSKGKEKKRKKGEGGGGWDKT